MTGCERCNTVNTAKRHVYIVLFKGDDSDFAWNQNIEITLETEMDLTGFRAKFSFMDFTQEFTDITSKKLVLVFPAAATSSFPLGAADASIVLYDSDGKARTIANRIHMIVTKCVDEAYANEDPQAITVSISSSREQADWDETDTQSPSYIRNKPKIPSIDTTLTQSGAAADAKAVGDALRGGFTPWEFGDGGTHVITGPFDGGGFWYYELDHSYGDLNGFQTEAEALAATSLEFAESQTATRRLITPTKTSQLTNDSGFITQHQQLTPIYSATPTFSEWTFSDVSDGITDIQQPVFHPSPDGEPKWRVSFGYDGETRTPEIFSSDEDATSLAFVYADEGLNLHLTATRTRTDIIGYTLGNQTDKPLQPQLTTNQLNAVDSGVTSAKVATWDGYAAQIAAKANASDVNAALAQKASLSDLPYRLVEPGKWEFSDGVAHAITGPRGAYEPETQSHYWLYASGEYYSQRFESEELATSTLSISFENMSGDTFTATRASLPGHLIDRAGSRVKVTGDTTLTLPAAVPGHLRDFLVRLEISGSTVPTITFAAPTGETLTYETDGDDFPVPDAAGVWLYSFTESCVAHKFAVALKKVNEVAAPQAQGGS